MSKKLAILSGAATSKGRKEENQDAMAIQVPEGVSLEYKGITVAIADGVSSSANARDASHSAVASFVSDYYSTPDSWTVKHAASKVLAATNAWLYQQSMNCQGLQQGWLTTFTSMVLKSNTAHILHVGDTRLYRVRKKSLESLTRDHTTRVSAKTSYLGRALGGDIHVDVDYRQESLELDDVFILTSDGVHEHVSETQLMECAGLAPQEGCDRLIEIAANNESPDNLSVIICKITSLPKENEEEFYAKLTALPFPPNLQPGLKLEHYKILETLQESSRSQVYLAEDQRNKNMVVIKTPAIQFEDDPNYLAGFLREEWIGTRIDHPNVLKVYPPSKEKQFMYLVCEYVPGMTLRQWMNDNPTPDINDIREYIKQISSGLRALQRQSVIHQDLKPENIMIDKNNRIRIIDLGAVHISGEKDRQQFLADIPAGSKNYVAPEYLMGLQGSHQSDIFSLGVITYELLCSALPYREMVTSQFKIKRYSELSYHSIRLHRKDIPAWVDYALKKATAPNPHHRYSALSEFNFDLANPNPDVEKHMQSKPLLETHPLLVWKSIAAFSVLMNIYLLYKLFNPE